MPQRFLRPGITNSERWNTVSFEAQSLFIRILTLVDDFGRYDARIAILHGQCFALRNDIKPQRTAAMRSELQRAKLIDVYEVDGREYLQIEQWQERARQDRSKFPDKSQVVEISTPAANGSEPQPNPASIDHRPSTISPSTIDPIPSVAAVAAKGSLGEFVSRLEGIEGFEKAWSDFEQHRKEIKKPITPLAARNILETLLERPGDAVAALRMAIRRGWQGFEWAWFDKDRPKPVTTIRENIKANIIKDDE